MAIRIFAEKSGGLGFTTTPFTPEAWAHELISSFEEEACIAFLEALHKESAKAINRHAQECGELGDESFWDDPPEWAVKYKKWGV